WLAIEGDARCDRWLGHDQPGLARPQDIEVLLITRQVVHDVLARRRQNLARQHAELAHDVEGTGHPALDPLALELPSAAPFGHDRPDAELLAAQPHLAWQPDIAQQDRHIERPRHGARLLVVREFYHMDAGVTAAVKVDLVVEATEKPLADRARKLN